MDKLDHTAIGSITWTDLTVKDAEKIKDFYCSVVGWNSNEVDMGSYSDFCLNKPHNRKTVAGICHALGSNVDLPPQWLIYITVKNIEESTTRCIELGGEIIVGPKNMGEQGIYCVIRDPAGAVAALFQQTT